MSTPAPLQRFVRDVSALIETAPDEAARLRGGRRLLEQLVANDDWLPEAYAKASPDRYQQHLLHRDPAGRFSVVSFVWGPGQSTPVHDHTVWGLVGVLRGAERSQRFAADGTGPPVPLGPPERLERGAVEAVSPSVGDVHRVENALEDEVSVSIHLYGADIGRVERATYPPEGGRRPFVSGYANGLDAPPFDIAPEIAVPTITPAEVRLALIARREIALIDLREEYAFALGHPLFAVSLSLSRLELEVYDRLPRRDVPIVLYDDGEGLVAPAAERLARFGYTDVRALEGGLGGWRGAGYELFADVNSYSKAFGELVEARRHTPSLPAPELQARQQRGEDLVVLDARRFEEFRTMSIPGGISTPGAELVLRAREIAPDPATTIVVNCAGRTRSLIGAQSLINAGVPNPVFALRNGTIGWTLAGQALDHGRTRRAPQAPRAAAEQAAAAARTVAYRAGVRRITPAELERLAAETSRTLYRFDVRSPEEFEAGRLPEFRSAPGGQLVQESDVSAPVRGARIVLYDDLGARADMTASWLAQMGWEVLVLEQVPPGWLDVAPTPSRRPPPPVVETLEPLALQGAMAAGALVVDITRSPNYRRGHIPGAAFAIRSRLAEAAQALRAAPEVVLTCASSALSPYAAPEIEALIGRPVRVLAGGTDAWALEGLPLEAGDGRALTPFEDVYRRPYEGTDNAAAAMQAYLDWEFGLVAQLERDGSHGFFVI